MEKIPVRTLQATPNWPSPEGFRIRRIATLTDGHDMTEPLHRHDFYYILVIEQGSGAHEIDFTAYPLAGATIFFMRPGQVHQLTLHAGTTGYLVQFPASFYYPQQPEARMHLRRAGASNSYTCDTQQFATLLGPLDALIQEYHNRQEDCEAMIQAQLSVFLIGLNRIRNRQNTAGSTYQQEQLDAFLDLLEKHIATHKQAGQYAALLHLSPYQLGAITHATVGKTPSILIREQGILEAKRLLLATSRLVSQIADDLGYDDVSYFVRWFRKCTGHTPEAFRRLSGSKYHKTGI